MIYVCQDTDISDVGAVLLQFLKLVSQLICSLHLSIVYELRSQAAGHVHA